MYDTYDYDGEYDSEFEQVESYKPRRTKKHQKHAEVDYSDADWDYDASYDYY